MENPNVNEIVEVRETALATDLSRLTNAGTGTNFYCSIPDNGTRENKVAIYNAINNAQHKIDDVKGKELKIVDIVAHPVEMVADDTGEIINCLRVVLIDDKGAGYESVATGVMSSLEKIFGIVGMPTYNPPLVMIPREQKTRKGFKTLVLDLK